MNSTVSLFPGPTQALVVTERSWYSDGMDSPLTLKNDAWTLEWSPPGHLYRGSRFDWTTQVIQVSGNSYPFLTREKIHEDSRENQGQGLAGEWGIETPLTWTEVDVGGWAPKIGVGWIQKPDNRPYHFARDYPIEPCHFAWNLVDESSLRCSAWVEPVAGWGWHLERLWRLGDGEVTLTTTIQNSGTRAWSTEEYIHNFLAPGGLSVDKGWTLKTPRPLRPKSFGEWVNPDGIFHRDDQGLSWSGRPKGEFFVSSSDPQIASWKLEVPDGWQISETAGSDVQAFHVWGKAHVVSPELIVSVVLGPGETRTMVRRWTFRVAG